MANKNEKINVAIEFSFPLYTCVPSSAAKERGVGRKSETGKEEKKRRASSLGLCLPPPCVSLSSFSLAFSPSPLPPPLPALQNKLPDCPPCPSSAANTASAAARKPTSAALAAAFGTEFPLREAAAPATPAQTR